MKFLLAFLLYVGVMVYAYCMFAFILWNADPTQWDTSLRGVYAVIFSIIGLWSASAVVMNYED